MIVETRRDEGTSQADGGQQFLFRPHNLGSLVLPNRIVMAPMTRGRTLSPDRIPGDLEAEYYAQRASAAFVITGGTYISPQAIGGMRSPGIYTDAQVEGWKKITGAVHGRGGRIFLQIAHPGSVSHPDLLDGQLPVAPSPVNAAQKVFTPTGFQDTVAPQPLTVDGIRFIVDDFGRAAKRAKYAGFDGVEVHGANAYLIPQFLNSATNHREDEYGGSPENRVHFALEVLEAIAAHWTKNQIGFKLNPGLNGVGSFIANEDTLPTYDLLLEQLSKHELGYVQLSRPVNDVSTTAVAVLQDGTYARYRPIFRGTLIANLGFDRESGNRVVQSGDADLVSFARHFIANPDLPERFSRNVAIAEGDRDTYYQGGAAGYTTYPPYDFHAFRQSPQDAQF